MKNQSNLQNDLNAVLEILREIAEKSDSGNYIYRGEPEDYDRVSSSLWRECKRKMETEDFDIQAIEDPILESAKNYTSEQEEIEIWAELQHYGGQTNLIDFTTDSHIALFFACDRFFDKPGRVIFLGEKAQNENRVKEKTSEPTKRHHSSEELGLTQLNGQSPVVRRFIAARHRCRRPMNRATTVRL